MNRASDMPEQLEGYGIVRGWQSGEHRPSRTERSRDHVVPSGTFRAAGLLERLEAFFGALSRRRTRQLSS